MSKIIRQDDGGYLMTWETGNTWNYLKLFFSNEKGEEMEIASTGIPGESPNLDLTDDFVREMVEEGLRQIKKELKMDYRISRAVYADFDSKTEHYIHMTMRIVRAYHDEKIKSED